MEWHLTLKASFAATELLETVQHQRVATGTSYQQSQAWQAQEWDAARWKTEEMSGTTPISKLAAVVSSLILKKGKEDFVATEVCSPAHLTETPVVMDFHSVATDQFVAKVLSE